MRGDVRIFLSYPSEYLSDAETIAVRLRAAGHKVFFAPDDLPPGWGYDGRIHRSILNSNLVIFLLGPEFFQAARYSLTELEMTRKKWPSPVGHVLPVLMRPLDSRQIPGYLRAVTMPEPKGDAAAEIVNAVATLRHGTTSTLVAGGCAALVVLLVLLAFRVSWSPPIKVHNITTQTPVTNNDPVNLRETVNAYIEGTRRRVSDSKWRLLQSTSLYEISKFSKSRRDEMLDVFKTAGLIDVLANPRVAETSFSSWSCVMNPDVVRALGFAPLEPVSFSSYVDYLDSLTQVHGAETFNAYRRAPQNRADLLPCMLHLHLVNIDESRKTQTVRDVTNALRPSFKEMDKRYRKLIEYWRRPDIRYSHLSLGLFSIQDEALRDRLDKLEAVPSVRARMEQLGLTDCSQLTLAKFIATLLQSVGTARYAKLPTGN